MLNVSLGEEQKLLETIVIMSLLDPIDEQIARGDRWAKRMPVLTEERELLISEILGPGIVYRVVTERNLPQFIDKEIKSSGEFITRPGRTECLARHKGREVVSLDCKGLKKSDAYGWMSLLAKTVKQTPNLIVIIENIADIPSDPLCDDPQYVLNLLGHSWKNEKIYFGDFSIDRSQLTVILTATPEQKEFVGQQFRTDGYSWCEDFDVELDKIEEQLSEL